MIEKNDAAESRTRTVYVLLLRSSSAFSRLIHVVTKSPYTHSSIALHDDCREFYSFARKYASLPLPAGFVTESVDRGLMGRSPDAPCALLEVKVTEDEYRKICIRIRGLCNSKKWIKYSIKGTFMCYFGLPDEGCKKYFCSRFVAETLGNSGAIKLAKPASLYEPKDFLTQPELRLVYTGTLSGLRGERIAQES